MGGGWWVVGGACLGLAWPVLAWLGLSIWLRSPSLTLRASLISNYSNNASNQLGDCQISRQPYLKLSPEIQKQNPATPRFVKLYKIYMCKKRSSKKKRSSRLCKRLSKRSCKKKHSKRACHQERSRSKKKRSKRSCETLRSLKSQILSILFFLKEALISQV